MTTIFMKTRLITLLLSLLLLPFCLTAHAQPQKPQSEQDAILHASPELKKHYATVFINAFKNLCIANMGKMEQLNLQLQEFPLLPPDMTKVILNGAPGKAWAIEKSEENGALIMAIMDNFYYCAVLTMSADPDEMEKLFDEMTLKAPEKSEFSLLKEEQIKQGNGNILRRKSYVLTSQESSAVIQFTLKTNSIAHNNSIQGTIFMLVDQI